MLELIKRALMEVVRQDYEGSKKYWSEEGLKHYTAEERCRRLEQQRRLAIERYTAIKNCHTAADLAATLTSEDEGEFGDAYDTVYPSDFETFLDALLRLGR